ncbi:MAG TPA: glycosyltransferase [Candidatus Limnocylindrales bacterium]|nr:glycosyltransferase [Candidatus Limnocylindrales bacterium]
MSNFLFSTMPEPGHVNPAIPVAIELVRRGHRVLWHTGPAFRRTVESTGAEFVAFDRTPDLAQIPVEADPGTSGIAEGVSIMRRLFIDRVPGQVADYRRILESFPADAVVADMTSLGAATLRDLGGPPFATLGINPLTTLDPEIPPFGSGRPVATSASGRLRNRASHWMARRFFMPRLTTLLDAERAMLGLGPVSAEFADLMQSPYLHIMPTTPAFEYPRRNLAPQVHFVGPLLPASPAHPEPPVWWSELDGRRVVHVTQGTYATDAGSLIRPTIDALAGDDVLVIATTRDAGSLGQVPPNVRVAPFVPHVLLLPKVDAMVTNAGYNGVLTALAHGVPLVCAGQTEDKAEVSARVAWSGAGIDLRTSTPTRDEVRSAVDRVLREPAFRRNARRIEADFARHDGPREAADLLETLASTGAPVLREGSAGRA